MSYKDWFLDRVEALTLPADPEDLKRVRQGRVARVLSPMAHSFNAASDDLGLGLRFAATNEQDGVFTFFVVSAASGKQTIADIVVSRESHLLFKTGEQEAYNMIEAAEEAVEESLKAAVTAWLRKEAKRRGA